MWRYVRARRASHGQVYQEKASYRIGCSCINLISALMVFYFIYLFLIALQYWFDFCHTSTWIGHRCIYVPSLPPPTFSHPSRLLQSPGLSSLSHTENSHGNLFCVCSCTCFRAPPPSHPPLPLPTLCKSVLCVWVSIAALQIGWTIPSF